MIIFTPLKVTLYQKISMITWKNKVFERANQERLVASGQSRIEQKLALLNNLKAKREQTATTLG